MAHSRKPIARFLTAECLPIGANATAFVAVASLYAGVLTGAALIRHHANQVPDARKRPSVHGLGDVRSDRNSILAGKDKQRNRSSAGVMARGRLS